MYFSQPMFRGNVSFGPPAQFIVGLISQEALFPIQSSGPYEASLKELQLMLGVVVHANMIRQTIELLPLPESPESNDVAVRMRSPQ